MAEVAPAGDSNSPSANVTIASIGRQFGRYKKSKITFTDSSEIILVHEIIEKYLLSPGQTLSENEVRELLAFSHELEIRERALGYLAQRAHSRRQLRQKLESRGFSEPDIGRVLDYLAGRGYLDDEAYARAWVRSVIKKGTKGRFALAAELSRAGIDRVTARNALEEYSEAEEYRTVSRLIERYGEVSQPALIRRLTARGFPLYLVRKALEHESA
jgi:regulatory protein